MKLQCPKCRKMLPQIGNETLYAGDTVTCGLCLHIWTPVPVPLKPDTANAGTEPFAPCSENCEPARPLGAKNANDEREAGADAEHCMVCWGCGELMDLRSLDQVTFHESHRTSTDIQYSGSVKMCVHCAKSWDDCECKTHRHQP